MGVIGYDPKNNFSLEQIIAKADNNLYQGKKSGKNKCVFSNV